MITKTEYTVSPDMLNLAINSVPNFDFRLAFNQPTGRFFYDPWIIKDEYRGTVWEKILESLPVSLGEARLIKLEPGTCYRSHADIDDRWHLTLVGQQSYLIDLDRQQMHQTSDIGCWYSMDTSPRHSASNFGSIPRLQLVVRKLLKDNLIVDPITVTVKEKPNDPEEFSRYIFDDYISPWLNISCKAGLVGNVKVKGPHIQFDVNRESLQPLLDLINATGLTIEYEH